MGEGIGFARAARRFWWSVFPAVAREVQRRRELAFAIPDPALRRMALQSLECKRCNLEGAAAYELLAGKASSPQLVRALSACQTICDYLDVLAEQAVGDPMSNGYRLHEALVVALDPAAQHRDYYAYHSHRDDGGYLRTLVEDVQAVLAQLPSLATVRGALERVAQRIAVYQRYNHGDAAGSYLPFERWARTLCPSSQQRQYEQLSWWEAGAGAGSTVLLFALIAAATDPQLDGETVRAMERAYFPWIGALHTLLDSLVDLDEDREAGGRCLVGCYSSPQHAAQRMGAIASRALLGARELPHGSRHALVLIGMTGFYLSDARCSRWEHARAIHPRLRSVMGALLGPAALMIGARRVFMAREPAPGAHAVLDAGGQEAMAVAEK